MTYSFNPNIPATADKPSVDQPAMLINNSSTFNLIAVDHVGFNTANGGRHNQVTFNDYTTQTTPANPVSILFTMNQNNAAQLFHYNSANTTQYTPDPTGSTVLLGGIILKWGQGTGFVNGVVSFTTPFPNNCYTVVAQVINSNAATVVNDAVYVYNFTVTGFNATATKRTLLASNTINFTYIAIGN
jgi:hypothetical protein